MVVIVLIVFIVFVLLSGRADFPQTSPHSTASKGMRQVPKTKKKPLSNVGREAMIKSNW